MALRRDGRGSGRGEGARGPAGSSPWVGIVYATLSAQLAAAMKVLRLGQNAAQSVLTAALAETPRIVATAMTVERDAIGWFNPWLDIASARHETAAARMFIS